MRYREYRSSAMEIKLPTRPLTRSAGILLLIATAANVVRLQRNYLLPTKFSPSSKQAGRLRHGHRSIWKSVTDSSTGKNPTPHTVAPSNRCHSRTTAVCFRQSPRLRKTRRNRECDNTLKRGKLYTLHVALNMPVVRPRPSTKFNKRASGISYHTICSRPCKSLS